MPRTRSICLSTLQIGATSWLWPRFIPLGCLVAFDGDPECGKSMISVDLAARLSRGAALPDGTPVANGRPHRTLILNAEDDFETTVLPRLRAAGANLDNIFTMCNHDGQVGGRAMCLPRDIAAIEEIVRAERIDLIVIDPLVAFLDEHFSVNCDQVVRRALQPLADLNRATSSTSIMVRHLNKNVGQRALYRGGGSIGVIGTARSGLLAARHPHQADCYILTANKMNLSEKPPAMLYQIVPGAPAKVEWLGPEQVTADAALNPEETNAPGIFRAMGWLRSVLADGPRLASEVILEATAAGISERTLERAKKEFRAQSFFQRIDGTRSWVWAASDYKDARARELEERFGPAPVIEEADEGVQARLSKAGRDVLKREKLQWAEQTLKMAAKINEVEDLEME
jgi:AAA domain